MKPRIRYVKPYFFGLPCSPTWVCSSPESTQTGSTPEEAYRAWLADMPKSYIGCVVRRISNKIADALIG